MTRTKYKSQALVEGVDFEIRSLETLEYSGEWVSSGFEVWRGNKSKFFVGYPTEDDILKWFNNGS